MGWFDGRLEGAVARLVLSEEFACISERATQSLIVQLGHGFPGSIAEHCS